MEGAGFVHARGLLVACAPFKRADVGPLCSFLASRPAEAAWAGTDPDPPRYAMKPKPSAALASLLFLLPACGGGGGGGSAERSGVLAPPIAGIAYETPTLAGTTDASGGFLYRSGESVLFRLGGVVLGEARGAASVDAFALAGLPGPIVGTSELRNRIEDEEDPFQHLLNLAVLLASADRDGDLANGVDVPGELVTALAGGGLELGIPHGLFGTRPALHAALSVASLQGVFGATIRKPVPTFRAVPALYEALGLADPVTQLVRQEEDQDGDGLVDRVLERTYDAQGFLVREAYDDDVDGLPDRIDTMTYDALGRLLERTYDANGDGVADAHDYVVFTSGGGWELHKDGDGDGVDDSVEYLEMDAFGAVAHSEWDHDGDGTISFRTTYLRDGRGNVEEILDEDLATPQQSVRRTRAWDERDRLLLEETDFGLDGVERSLALVYASASATRRPTLRTLDENGDGVADTVLAQEYDARGRITRWTTDDGADGVLDFERTWRYDAAGHRTRETTDYGADGRLDQVLSWTYDAQGRPTRFTADHDGDGVIDEREITTYAGSGGTRRADEDGDGVDDSTGTFILDAWGNEVLRTDDEDADGTPDGSTTRVYAPTGWGELLR